MKKQMLFTAVAGLTLVSAHPAPPAAPLEAKYGYPPCSRTVTDRCIQMNERSARSAANLARNAGPVTASLPTPPRATAEASKPDDIDVSYAGEVLQAPRAGHHPGAAPGVQVRRDSPRDGPTRVVVIREQRRAHGVDAMVHADHPPMAAPPPHAMMMAHSPSAAPSRVHQPARRQYSMRVRRAGERG